MADPIAAQFRGPWQLESRPQEECESAVVQVLMAQAAWRALTKNGRRALVDLAEVPGCEDWWHPLTFRALVSHGLVAQSGELTPAGQMVVRYRPDKAMPSHPEVVFKSLANRPVTDVQLPGEAR